MNAEVGTASTEQPTGTPGETPAAPAPAPAAPAPGPAEGGAEQTSTQQAQERDEQGRFRNPVQPRIDELTRKAREAEREAAYWRERATVTQAPAPAAPKKPEPADFNDYGEYVEALAEFKADEKVGKALDAREAKQAQQQQATQRATTWEQRQTQARSAIQDYDAVLESSDVPIAQHVGEALLESDHGPALAYHLAKNPAVADKLNAMTPLNAAREIGRIEASLAAGSAAPSPAQGAAPAAPAARTTNAPPPGKPVQQAGNAPVDLSKLSMDDYVKHRKSQGASWAR